MSNAVRNVGSKGGGVEAAAGASARHADAGASDGAFAAAMNLAVGAGGGGRSADDGGTGSGGAASGRNGAGPPQTGDDALPSAAKGGTVAPAATGTTVTPPVTALPVAPQDMAADIAAPAPQNGGADPTQNTTAAVPTDPAPGLTDIDVSIGTAGASETGGNRKAGRDDPPDDVAAASVAASLLGNVPDIAAMPAQTAPAPPPSSGSGAGQASSSANAVAPGASPAARLALSAALSANALSAPAPGAGADVAADATQSPAIARTGQPPANTTPLNPPHPAVDSLVAPPLAAPAQLPDGAAIQLAAMSFVKAATSATRQSAGGDQNQTQAVPDGDDSDDATVMPAPTALTGAPPPSPAPQIVVTRPDATASLSTVAGMSAAPPPLPRAPAGANVVSLDGVVGAAAPRLPDTMAAAANDGAGSTGISDPGAFATAVAQRVIGMIANGHQEATLQLQPPQLGDLTVRVSVQGHDVSTWFSAPQAPVQLAVSQALDQLRADLAGAGFNLAGAWVGADASTMQRGAYDSDAPPSRRGSYGSPALAPAAIDKADAAPASGVSVYV